jgi:hypothetical protein
LVEGVPRRLKPQYEYSSYGTAEAVPLSKTGLRDFLINPSVAKATLKGGDYGATKVAPFQNEKPSPRKSRRSK